MLALLPLGLLAALVAVLVAGARTDSSSASASAGSTRLAPAFTLEDLRTPGVTFEFDGRPERPTVVNFFGSWCVPCRDELPLLAAASQRRPGVDFIAVDVRDARHKGLELLDATGVAFPAAFDPRRELAGPFGLTGMPTTVFIAPGGRIVRSVSGAMSTADLADALDELEAA